MAKFVEFTKMAGAGNDFIIIDNRAKEISENPARIAKRLCERKFSIGADGLLLLEKSKKADVRMRIFNPDGSEAEMCGNGVRCLAEFAFEKKITKSRFSVETPAGRIGAEVCGNIVKAKLIDPTDLKLNFEVDVNGKKELLNFINTGVPHVVKVVDRVEHFDLSSLAPAVRYHAYFAPRGTNVNFISIKSDKSIDVRTYERGVEGETLACGTGSAASALVAASLKSLKSPVLVHTRGGEALKVYFLKNGSQFKEVYLEGEVVTTFEGRVKL